MSRPPGKGYLVRLVLSPAHPLESEIIAHQMQMTSAAARRSHLRRLLALGHQAEKEQRKTGEGALTKIGELLSETVKSEPPLPFRRQRIEESRRREQDQDTSAGSGHSGQRLEAVPPLGVTPTPASPDVAPAVDTASVSDARSVVGEFEAVVEPSSRNKQRTKLGLGNLFIKAE